MGSVWTGEFDFNTLRVDEERKLADSKIFGYVWTRP